MFSRIRTRLVVVIALMSALLLSSCAGAAAMTGEEFSRAINGVAGTMSSYNENSQLIDRVKGVSFRFARDDRFDTRKSDGGSNADSSVVMISLGNSHMFHVGSTMIFAQEGITDVTAGLPATVDISNTTPGTPWLNDIRERFQNLWRGKAKTIMARSQNGTPLKVFAADEVETFATDIPKSTAFRLTDTVGNKRVVRYLLIYRADYTVYDTDLLR